MRRSHANDRHSRAERSDDDDVIVSAISANGLLFCSAAAKCLSSSLSSLSTPSSNKSAGFGITHDSWIVKRMSISGATHVNDDDVWPPLLKQRYGLSLDNSSALLRGHVQP